MIWARLFAAIAIVYGVVLIAFSFVSTLPALNWINGEHMLGIPFVTGVLFFAPCVITYTVLGLNCDEGGLTLAAVKARHAQLAAASPVWRPLWYATVTFLIVATFAAPLRLLPIHPFHAYGGAMALFSGVWFAFVYPTARELFGKSPGGLDKRG